MKKYEIKKNTREVKSEKDIHSLCTLEQDWQEPFIEESFDDKDEAIEALKKYKCAKEWMSGYWLVTEYYVEENEYDEDGEFVTGGDILKAAEMRA